MTERIRILIVDDHTLFRSGLISLLERYEQFDLIGETGDVLEGIKRARELKPDVILLDLHMPGISGLEALKVLNDELPRTQVLMLTVSEDGEDLKEALCSGAAGYLLKNIETSALVEAIRKVAAGESVISPQMTAKLVESVRNPAMRPFTGNADAGKEKLSPREREILVMLATGETNKEIARKLDLAESTVKIHVQNIFKKLNINSRVQAAVYAVERGYDIQ